MDAAAALLLTLCTIASGDGIRRWLDAERRGAEAWLAGIVAAMSALLLAGFALGSIGELRRIPLLAAMAIAAGTTQSMARRRRPNAPPAQEDTVHADEPPWLARVAIGGCVLTGIVWAAGAYKVFTRGVVDVDSHHYHLSHALRFAQTGHILPLHHVWSGDLAAYHPSNDELIRAMGMLVGRSDLPGVLWNAVATATGLLAAFVFGRRIGRPATATLMAAAALTIPGVALPFAGGSTNDHLALSMLLAAVALSAGARGGGSWVMVGAAAGIALGTKLTVLPAVAIFVVITLLRRAPVPAAARRAGLLLGLLATGSIWYARNWAIAGNPVPGLELPGPLSLNQPTAPTLDAISHSIASYATDLDIVRSRFLPGLDFAFGPLWPVVLGITLLGMAAGVAGWRGRTRRTWLGLTCAAVAAVSVVAYLLTPTGAGGPAGDPWLFRSNARYLLPATVLGGWAALSALRTRWVTALGTVTAATAITGALASIDGAFSTAVTLLAGGAALLASLLWPRRLPSRVVGAVALIVLSLGAVASAELLRGPYLDHQYRPLPRMGPLFIALSDAPPGSRVGVVGLPDQYGYAGRRLQSTVQFIGRETADGGYLAMTSCRDLMTAIADGDYDYLAVNGPEGDLEPVERGWVEADPSFELLASTPTGGAVFRAPDEPLPGRCEP